VSYIYKLLSFYCCAVIGINVVNPPLDLFGIQPGAKKITLS